MEEIKDIINDIKTHAAQLKSELQNVRLEKNSLQEMLDTVTQNLQQKEEQVIELYEKIEWLVQQPKEVVAEESVKNDDLEIDALVREIDDCINRLKQ